MGEYKYLLDLAIILLTTKLLGLATKKVQMPQVVGALCAGLILGPAMLGWIKETNFLAEVAELGVIVLMFNAGLETDITELKKAGKASFIIALMGVLVPLGGGFVVAHIFTSSGEIALTKMTPEYLQNIFVGVILTATSVSITVETLKELGKLKTKSGNAILGAAIIDDILGIIALTIVTSMADSSVSIAAVLLKIVLFFVFAGVVGFVFYLIFKKWTEMSDKGLHRHAIIAFVFCLVMAFVAEVGFGVADITGAFIAGLIIGSTAKSEFVAKKFDTVSYMLLSPVFFASIGLKVVLPQMSATIIIFTVVLVIVAILTKIVGCGLGAKMCHYENFQAIRIGVGMISRGEVALIVASKGAAVGLLGDDLLGPIVIVVVITTIITPILLKLVFKDTEKKPVIEEPLSPYYEDVVNMRENDYSEEEELKRKAKK